MKEVSKNGAYGMITLIYPENANFSIGQRADQGITEGRDGKGREEITKRHEET